MALNCEQCYGLHCCGAVAAARTEYDVAPEESLLTGPVTEQAACSDGESLIAVTVITAALRVDGRPLDKVFLAHRVIFHEIPTIQLH